MSSAKLIGLLHKRTPFSLPETDVVGEFRVLSTEEEAKAEASAAEDLRHDKLMEGVPTETRLYWTSYYEDCAKLALAMMDGERRIYETARLLRASLAREEIDYLARAYRDFKDTIMPKFDEIGDAQADELIHDFLALNRNPTEWAKSGSLRECRRLVPSLVSHFLRLMSVSGVSYTSLREPLTVSRPETRTR